MGKNRLIFDTDGGVDDAQALLLLIANGRIPDAITTVFGNVEMQAATTNMLATLAVAGVGVPVHMGSAGPLTQHVVDAKHVHGEDGLGGAPRPDAIAEPAGDDAIHFLRESLGTAAKRGEEIDLLMIGPLTNLAMALRLDPAIRAGIGQLTIMGGTVYGRGNTTPSAEFNVFADPEAASIVFGADIETVIVPWEPCVTHCMAGSAVDELFAVVADGPYKYFSQTLARHARQRVAGYGGGDAFRFVDPFAASIVIDPTIISKSLSASVDVALAPGLTRGMTVVDPSGRLGTPPVTLVEEADLQRLIALYANSLAYTPSTMKNQR